MRSVSLACAFAASAVLALSTGGAADAAVGPVSVVPTAPNGDTVDCVVQFSGIGSRVVVGDNGKRTTVITSGEEVNCSPAADIHRRTVTATLYRVMADGTKQQLGVGGGGSQSTEPMSGGASSQGWGCGDFGPTSMSGTHTYVVRTVVKLKHTLTWQGTPYVAATSLRGAVTCP